MSSVLLMPDIAEETTIREESLWVVLLHNDPVNTAMFVTHVLSAVFEYSKAKAEGLMMQAHTEGKAPVWAGELEHAEGYAVALGTYGLSATVAEG